MFPAKPAALLLSLAVLVTPALARDDGRYGDSPLKPWFERLQSDFGKCYTDVDGYIVSDADWESNRGRYRVRIDNEWVDVPDGAVVKRTKPFRPYNGLEALHRRPSTRPMLHARQHDLMQF